MIWLWMILLIGMLAAVALASMVTIRLHLIRETNNDHFTLKVKALFGLLQYKVEIPYVNFQWLRGLEFRAERSNMSATGLAADDRAHLSLESIADKYRTLKILVQNFVGFDEWITDTLSHAKCTELQWVTRIGLGDAPNTAISVGVIWGLKTNLLGFITKYITLDSNIQPHLAVDPQFNQSHFSTMVISKIRIRLAYVVLAGFWFIVRLLRTKGGLKTWQNQLFRT
jgi:hypothetical protein